MKKDIEWVKDKLKCLKKHDLGMWKQSEPNSKSQSHFNGSMSAIDKALDFLDQLDEPEILSQEWIEENTYHNHYVDKGFVYVNELKGKLVPKKMNILEIEAMLDDIGWWDSSTEEQVIVMAIEKGEIGHEGKQYKIVEVSKEER